MANSRDALAIASILILAVFTVLVASGTRTFASGPISKFQSAFISTPESPSSVVYDSFDHFLYVSYGDGASGGVAVVNGTTNLANVTLDSGPGPLLYDPSNHLVYAAGVNSQYLFEINGTAVVGRVATSHPTSLIYDPTDGLVYLATQGFPAIQVINQTKTVGGISADCSVACNMLYDPSNGYLYVANTGDSSVSVIDGTSVISTLKAGAGPSGMTFDPSNNLVYVVNGNHGFGGNVTAISGTEPVATIEVGTSPSGLFYDPGNGYIYVTDNQGISIIKGTTDISNVSLGFIPSAGAFDPGNGLLYYPNSAGYVVGVLNGTREIATVTVGPSPYAALFNPANEYVYVSDNGFFGMCSGCVYQPSETVSVVDGCSAIENVTVGYDPTALYYDPALGSVYVDTVNGIYQISQPEITPNSSSNCSTVEATSSTIAPMSSSSMGLTSQRGTSRWTTTDSGTISTGRSSSPLAVSEMSFELVVVVVIFIGILLVLVWKPIQKKYPGRD